VEVCVNYEKSLSAKRNNLYDYILGTLRNDATKKVQWNRLLCNFVCFCENPNRVRKKKGKQTYRCQNKDSKCNFAVPSNATQLPVCSKCLKNWTDRDVANSEIEVQTKYANILIKSVGHTEGQCRAREP
jgi:hypothetical protein